MDYPKPAPCIHSAPRYDCTSCWYGMWFRQNLENERLRQLIEQYGSAMLKYALAKEDERWLGANAPESSKKFFGKRSIETIAEPTWDIRDVN